VSETPVGVAGTPEPELRSAGAVELGANRNKDRPMPQMFDWIFFAIMLPFPAYLVWDFMKHG
jgi:hypothetical protein